MKDIILVIGILMALVSVCDCRISIIQTWNGVYSEGERGVLAARTTGDIETCMWFKVPESSRGLAEDVLIFSSEKTSVGGQVEIEEGQRLCKLFIDRLDDRVHSGIWEVEVTGRCGRRSKRQVVEESPITELSLPVAEAKAKKEGKEGEPKSTVEISPAGGIHETLNAKTPKVKHTRTDEIKTRFSHRKASAAKLRSAADNQCGSVDRAGGIRLEVGDRDTLVAIPAQENVVGLRGSLVILSARTNMKPDRCIAELGGERLELRSGSRETCDNRFQRSGRVCIESYESREDGIFGCHVRIDSMDRDLQGRWTIEVEQTARRRQSEQVDIDVSLADVPRSMKILHERREVRSRDTLEANGREFEIECSATGDNVENMHLELYAGDKAIVPTRRDTCYDGDLCTTFFFPPTRSMDGMDLTCVAHAMNFDAFDDRQATYTAGTFKIDRYAASLLDSDSQSLVVCARDMRRGDELDLEVEFESDPEPFVVEWRIQTLVGTSREFVAGDDDDQYESYTLEEIARNTYVAALAIDGLEDEDLNIPNNHQLLVDNGLGDVVFNITIITDCVGRSGGGSSPLNDYQCDLSDRDCRCDSSSSSRRCCDNSASCRHNCCERCLSSTDRNCIYCDQNRRNCVQLKEETVSDKYQCDMSRERDCRCDSTSSTRECCDASPRCTGSNCCQRCSSSDSTRICNLCDDRGTNCMKLNSEEYQCELRDRDCRCDSTRSTRECCDASSRCTGENCCQRCSSSDSRSVCNLCDESGRNCMKLTAEKYQCELRDRDCRCDSTRNPRECCDASSRCTGDNCCQRCRSGDSSRVCNLCDDRGNNCMKLTDDSSPDTGRDYQCTLSTNNRDCRCDSTRSDRRCCDASSRCRREECCERCSSSDSRSVCNMCDVDGRNCMKAEGLSSIDQCDPERDRDCICYNEYNYCCSVDRSCRGDNCCRSCREGDRNCVCKSRGRDCYEIPTEFFRSGSGVEVIHPLGNVCQLPKDPGGGRNCGLGRLQRRFYFDMESRECDSFEYSGCDGNANNFQSLEDCQDTCEFGRARLRQSKATRLLLDSCLQMSATLLEYWQPDGDRRDSSQSERDFQRDLEDFFVTAKCTGFDEDIQDYVNDPDRRTSPLISGVSTFGNREFLSSLPGKNPANKVEKVDDTLKKTGILETAKAILDKAGGDEDVEVEESAVPDGSS